MLNTEERKLVPFLKWAGGKRWLTEAEPELFPESFERYYEPFMGAAAVYFHIMPKRAILADVNEELTNTYLAIKSNWKLVFRYLGDHQRKHCSTYYYEVRAQRPISMYTRAARMLYLNRTCWNGLYRVNLKGQFNVPIGTKTKVLLTSDDFEGVAKQLAGTEIVCSDFEAIVDRAKKNDFLFVDPPYTVKHNYNGFIKYNENLFAWDDQVRLRNSVMRAVSRGVKVLVLNAAHDSIRELYADFQQIELSRKNVLAGKPEFRGVYGELAIKTWG